MKKLNTIKKIAVALTILVATTTSISKSTIAIQNDAVEKGGVIGMRW